jgi:hypothetical protein
VSRSPRRQPPRPVPHPRIQQQTPARLASLERTGSAGRRWSLPILAGGGSRRGGGTRISGSHRRYRVSMAWRVQWWRTYVLAWKEFIVRTKPHIRIWSGKNELTCSVRVLTPSGSGGSTIIFSEILDGRHMQHRTSWNRLTRSHWHVHLRLSGLIAGHPPCGDLLRYRQR